LSSFSLSSLRLVFATLFAFRPGDAPTARMAAGVPPNLHSVYMSGSYPARAAKAFAREARPAASLGRGLKDGRQLLALQRHQALQDDQRKLQQRDDRRAAAEAHEVVRPAPRQAEAGQAQQV